MRELSEAEYVATFSGPMHRLGPDEDAPAYCNVGQYLKAAIQALALPTTSESIDLTDIYVGDDRRHTHLLFDYGARNVRLVVVVDNDVPCVHGHRLVDFGRLYSVR